MTDSIDSPRDPISQMCSGMAHELSNTLTFMLPAIEEIDGLHGDLHTLLWGDRPAADQALHHLGTQVAPEDLLRMTRQLHLSASRLRRFHQDLRLGFACLLPERIERVALGEIVQRALLSLPDPARVELPHPWPPQEAPLVQGDRDLLYEAVARLLRAAVGWSRAAASPAPVRLSLTIRAREDRAGSLARIGALLPGDAARLPAPEELMQMLCPSETGAQRAERGPLGIMVAVHLFRVHGGDLRAAREPAGVALWGEVPLPGPDVG